MTRGAPAQQITGVCNWFTAYGFITPDGGGKDVFVHFSASDGYQGLAGGDKVRFELVKGPQGFEARNVVRVEG